jgi:ElaB/YqjD/DUF883 family membrane-anchored ribosome-binding protein
MAITSNRIDSPIGQAREYAEAATGHLQQAGSEARQAAEAAAAGLSQKTQDAARSLSEKAKEAAAAVSQRAGDLAHKAQDQADDALASMGQRMTSMAGSLRQAAPREGVAGTAAGAFANRLESGGRYLQDHGVSEISDDVTGIVRRNPLPALGIAFGVGVVIGLVWRGRR